MSDLTINKPLAEKMLGSINWSKTSWRPEEIIGESMTESKPERASNVNWDRVEAIVGTEKEWLAKRGLQEASQEFLSNPLIRDMLQQEMLWESKRLPDLTKIHTLAFDLDGTLAVSKQPMSAEMAHMLAKLSHFFNIAIVSGGDWPQFEQQVVPPLRADRICWGDSFTMMPTCGAKVYKPDRVGLAGWVGGASARALLASYEVEKIIEILNKAVQSWPARPIAKIWGPQIENRGTQITFSALGQQAPIEVKREWDPDAAKRKELVQTLSQSLWHENYSVRIGGTTSVDITRAGIDKAFALEQLNDGTGTEGILFIGDALFDGGNDAPVKQTGCQWWQVDGPDETLALLRQILVVV